MPMNLIRGKCIFHLRKSVVTFAKKKKIYIYIYIYIFKLTEHLFHKNFGSSKHLFQENEIQSLEYNKEAGF